MSTSTPRTVRRIRWALASEVVKARADRVAQRDFELRPLSQHARVSFPVRGTCDVCGLTDVACRVSGDVPNTYPLMDRFVCALCTMQGRG